MRKAISAGGILVDNGKILFVRFPDTMLTFPKGTVEEGENLEETALREMREETGLSELKIIRKLGVVTRKSVTRAGERVMKDIHLYLMNSNNLVQNNAEEITEWHTVTEAMSQMHKEEVDFLKSIAKSLEIPF